MFPAVEAQGFNPWTIRKVQGFRALKKKKKAFSYFFKLVFWLHLEACGILDPRPGIKPATPAVEVQSLDH